MNEADKTIVKALIDYGFFDVASDSLNMYAQKNSDDATLHPLFSLLQERISLLQAAENEPVDPRFYELMEHIASSSRNEIFKTILSNFAIAPDEYKAHLVDYLNAFQSLKLWGRLDPKKNIYGDFHLRAHILKKHYDDLMWLHEKLADARSKNVLYAVLANWVSMDCTALDMYKERVYPEYFDPKIFEKSPNEVFVDLGASVGDSAMHFLNSNRGNYKHIYCYEISPSTLEILKSTLKKYKNITIHQKGAWSSPGKLYLKECAAGVSANQVSESGEIVVETVRIDDDIPEPVTFVKMDIEGAEREALRGCARQIRENRPKLAICTYHGYEDIYAVPRLIDEIAPGYTFYMRYHGSYTGHTSEFSLLAVHRGEM